MNIYFLNHPTTLHVTQTQKILANTDSKKSLHLLQKPNSESITINYICARKTL